MSPVCDQIVSGRVYSCTGRRTGIHLFSAYCLSTCFLCLCIRNTNSAMKSWSVSIQGVQCVLLSPSNVLTTGKQNTISHTDISQSASVSLNSSALMAFRSCTHNCRITCSLMKLHPVPLESWTECLSNQRVEDSREFVLGISALPDRDQIMFPAQPGGHFFIHTCTHTYCTHTHTHCLCFQLHYLFFLVTVHSAKIGKHLAESQSFEKKIQLATPRGKTHTCFQQETI